MARNKTRMSHVPDYPSGYIALPSILLVTAVGLICCGIATLSKQEGLIGSSYDAIPLGLVTLGFQIYHLVAERKEKSYNYYAIVIPNSIMLFWFTSAIIGVGVESEGKGLPTPVDIVLLILVIIGWIISLTVVVLFAIAISKHRKGGGTSKRHRYESGAPRASRSDIENGAGSSEDVNMDRMDGNRNTSNDVNMNALDGNRDTLNNVNTSQDRASVHHVPGDPYHPLRMNPVDSMGTIKPIAPDMTGRKVETIENGEQVPNSSKSTFPLVSKSLPPDNTGSQTETIENVEQVPSSHTSTPPPVSEPAPPSGCTCEHFQ